MTLLFIFFFSEKKRHLAFAKVGFAGLDDKKMKKQSSQVLFANRDMEVFYLLESNII